MKLVKSLLLGSAAGLVAVAGASAADLGVKKPSAVEYVKTCPTYGAGFFVVPGTTSCLKLIGRVRVDYISGSNGSRHNGNGSRGSDLNVLRARAYVGYDHRTATEYGLLRTYVRAFVGNDNGAMNPATGPAVAGTASNAGAGASTYTVLEYAFIQFGGLTAGRVAPNFEHGWSQFFQLTNAGGMADITYVNAIGYTASFGGGFSATVAIEGAAEHRTAIRNRSGAAIGPAAATGGQLQFGGQSMPDIVGSLGYDASWGSIKLSGALHENRVNDIAGGAAGFASSKLGYAVGLGAKINLPFLTKGSNFWASGYYAEGASQYAGFNTNVATSYTIGGFNVAGNTSDASLDNTNRLRLTKAYGFSGALQVFVVPTVSVSVGGYYGKHNAFQTGNDFSAYGLRGQLAWNPAAGFLIGAEVGYNKVSGRAVAAGVDKDDFVGRLRFQRDF